MNDIHKFCMPFWQSHSIMHFTGLGFTESRSCRIQALSFDEKVEIKIRIWGKANEKKIVVTSYSAHFWHFGQCGHCFPIMSANMRPQAIAWKPYMIFLDSIKDLFLFSYRCNELFDSFQLFSQYRQFWKSHRLQFVPSLRFPELKDWKKLGLISQYLKWKQNCRLNLQICERGWKIGPVHKDDI